MWSDKLFIQPFEFENFINNDWGKFVDNALFEAHHKARHALSMGGGEVPKLHLLPGDYTKDQKYVTQFHPETMGHAIEQRYGHDLLKMGQHWDLHNKLPEDNNRAHGKFSSKIKKPGKKSKEEEGIDRYRNYKNVLSDILTPEEYADLDDEQKKAYDEAPTEEVKDEDGKMVPKKLLKIYTGHSHLAKALTAPAKIASNQHDYEGNEKFKPGIGLNDIKMHDKEGNVIEPSPEQVKEYLAGGHHGFYDFDLGKVRMVPKELHENLPDDQIVDRMSPDWKKQYAIASKDPFWKEKNEFSKLKKAIANTRKKIEKEPGHSMAGFEPIKEEKATTFLTDWIRASALGLLGPRLKDGDMVKDPVTGKKVPVHMMKASQAVKSRDEGGAGFTNRNLTVGFHPGLSRGKEKNPHPGEWEDIDIPFIQRMVSYEDQKGKEEGGASLGHKIEKIWVPYLYDAKTLPHIPWTTEQKAIIAHRKNPDLLPGFGDKDKPLTPDEKQKLTAAYEEAISKKKSNGTDTPEASKLKLDSTSIDITNIMNNWDLLTPEQKEHVVKNSRSLIQHAKAMHGRIENADKYSHGNYSHGLGYNVNKSSLGSSYLKLNPEQVKAVEQKYGKQMVAEATKGVYNWLYGSKASDAAMKAGAQGEDQKLSQSALVPQYVKAAMENIVPELIEISKYYLMTWLNDYWVGIDDPSVGLNAVKAPKIIENPEIATKDRIGKVNWLMGDISQAAISHAPPRRARSKFGHETGAISDLGAGDVDAGNLTSKEDQKDKLNSWQQNWWTKRLAKHPGEKIGTSWKGNLGEFTLPKIAEGIRQRVKDSLGAAAGSVVDKAMAKATARMSIALKLSLELKDYYDGELAKEKDEHGNPKYPTDEAREKAVSEIVKKKLPEALSNADPELFSNMSNEESEDLETKLREKQKETSDIYLHHDFTQDNPNYLHELEEAMNDFWGNVASEDAGDFIPKYNETNKQFEDSDFKVYLPDFWKRKEPVNAASVLQKMRAIYNNVSPNATSKVKAIINKNLADNALEVYKQILLDAHQATGKTDEQMKQELQQAGLGSDMEAPPQQVAAPQKMPQAQPMAAAANKIDDVLNSLAKYNSPAEFIQTANQLLAHAEDFKASPNHAIISSKIFSALEKMQARKTDMMIQNAEKKILPNKTEVDSVNNAYNKLRQLYKSLA